MSELRKTTITTLEVPMKSIYVVENEHGCIKIGVSQNVEDRIKTLSNQGGFRIKNLFYTSPCSNAYSIEKLAHTYFHYANINREWFEVDYMLAREVVSSIFEKFSIKIPKYEKVISLEDIEILFQNKNVNNSIEENRKIQNDLVGLSSFLREMEKIMLLQGSQPWKICEAFKMVSEQFGIRLPDDFVKVPRFEQM